MHEEHAIVQQVYEAKENMPKADALIRAYMPFIESETAKFLHRPPDLRNDDEVSIAMIAFHEAIQSYSKEKGAFFKYAAVLIKNRLIDFYRREKRHSQVLSIEAPTSEDKTLADTIPQETDAFEDFELRDATKNEIETLQNKMKPFGVSITDVAKHCPKQKRTLEECKKVARFAVAHPELLKIVSDSGRLPVQELVDGCGVSKKILERHRKYLIALLLIYTNGYVILRNHIKQIMEGGENA